MRGVEPSGLSALVPVAGLDAPERSVRDPYAQPGALTPPGARPIVKVLGIEKYFGTNHVLRGCTMRCIRARRSA